MKTFILILSIIHVITGFAVERAGNCDRSKKDPYPGDITKFIVCDNYIPVAKKCPSGHQFNPTVEVCEIGAGNLYAGNNDQYTEQSQQHNTVVVLPSNPQARPAQPNYQQQQLALQQQRDREQERLRQQRERYSGTSSTKTIHYTSGSASGPGYTNDMTSDQRHSGQYFHGTHNLNNLQHHTKTIEENHPHGVAGTDQSGSASNQHSVIVTPQPPLSHGSLSFGHTNNDHTNPNYNNHDGYTPKNTQTGTGGLNHHHDKNYLGSQIDVRHQSNHHQQVNVIGDSTGHSTEACRHVVPGTHIPYPGHCGKFIVCMADDEIAEKDCPPNTHFNAKMEICDWPKAAKCPFQQTTGKLY